MRFSVIVVALDPGEKLNQTLDSVLAQTYADYEIIVKDGGSRDGSLEKIRQDARIRLIASPDCGIYDAMNQAAGQAKGDYLLFLNCGDTLYDASVLERAASRVERETADAQAGQRMIFYGDTYGRKNDVPIASAPAIDGFVCYRNIPCHQSCFYAAELVREKPYEPKYRIRADYDHFLWCYYVARARMMYLGMTVAAYEGGGYSESKENRKRDREEHWEITKKYMSGGELFRYRAVMALTLAPLRRFLAENKVFAGMYHKIKSAIYTQNN